MSRNWKIALAGLFGLACMAGQASAASVTYGPQPIGPNNAGSAGSFFLPQFDPSLGTLTKVILMVNGFSDGGQNILDSESDFSGNASVSIGTNITVTGPATLTVLTTPVDTNSGPIGPDDEMVFPDFAGPDSIGVFGNLSTDSDMSMITSGMGPYIGLGNVTFNYSSVVNNSSSSTVSPSFTFNTPTIYSFDAKVTYEYDVIPEPSTFILAGLGAVGLVGYGLRRRVK
ncbi:MAG: PEP-CTERM sorting domain-containing protein [Pirellulales bacterium]|nr:PEP-CTERM sorting domain-containing protein [Pirellulales bacterium]